MCVCGGAPRRHSVRRSRRRSPTGIAPAAAVSAAAHFNGSEALRRKRRYGAGGAAPDSDAPAAKAQSAAARHTSLPDAKLFSWCGALTRRLPPTSPSLAGWPGGCGEEVPRCCFYHPPWQLLGWRLSWKDCCCGWHAGNVIVIILVVIIILIRPMPCRRRARGMHGGAECDDDGPPPHPHPHLPHPLRH